MKAYGHYVNGERHGTWHWYFHADETNSCGYWCKIDYENGIKIGKHYDTRYDDLVERN